MDDFWETSALFVTILCISWLHFRVIIRRVSRVHLTRIFILDGIALVIFAIGFFTPDLFGALFEEDFIGEWVTFYAFAVSGIIIATHLWGCRKNGLSFFSTSFLIPLALAAFCLAVAGEEISWGQRIFAFKPPDIFLEQNYQQELNIHNLFKGDGLWGIQIESKHMVMLIAFFYGILFPFTPRLIPRLENLNRHTPAFYMIPYFVLVIAMEKIYPISLTGEACEMYLGLIFLFHALDTYPIDRIRALKWNRLLGVSTLTAFVLALGIITAPLLDFFIYGSDAEAESIARKELELLQKDFLHPDAKKNKILRRRWVHKRIYTAVLQYYFRLPEDSLFLEGKQTPAAPGTGQVRDDRRGYFLDPWNNPYWIYFDGKNKVVVFYSFGPNRKRDSKLESNHGIKGDDIGTVFLFLTKAAKRAERKPGKQTVSKDRNLKAGRRIPVPMVSFLSDDFQKGSISKKLWRVTRQNDFAESRIDVVDIGNSDRRLRLRADTRGSHGTLCQ